MKTAIIIDDDELLKKIYKIFLQGEATVFGTKDYPETIKILKKIKVDIIFIDITISTSKIDGIKIYQKLLKIYPDIQYYFITCIDELTGSDIRHKLKNKIDILYKPVMKESLINIINQ